MAPVWGNQFLLSKEKEEQKGNKMFYSDDEEDSDEEDSSEEEDEAESDEKKVESEESEEEEEEEEDDEEESGEESEFDELSDDDQIERKRKIKDSENSDVSEDEESEEDEEEESSSEEESDESDDAQDTQASEKKQEKKRQTASTPHKASYDQLLDFDDDEIGTQASVAIGGAALVPSLVSDMESLSMDPKSYSGLTQQTSISSSKPYELLNKINGKGLSADYRFTRVPCIYSRTMVAVEIQFNNQSNKGIHNLKISGKKLTPGMQLQEFPEIDLLPAGNKAAVTIGIDFKDTMQPASFNLCTSTDSFSVSIKVPVGELIKAAEMTEHQFSLLKNKLTGMTECSLSFSTPSSQASDDVIVDKVLTVTCMNRVPSPPDQKVLRFAGKLVSSELPVLLSIQNKSNDWKVIVNCEKISIGNLLAKEMKNSLMN